jgi:hypothetical protein
MSTQVYVSGETQEYTGSEITTDVTVTWENKSSVTLTEGTDYDITYSNNIYPGDNAQINVKFKGNYTGTVVGYFTIEGDTSIPVLPSIEVESISSQVYTGKQITPDVTVSADGQTLVKGEDYTVEYGENIQAGTDAGSVTVKGNGTTCVGTSTVTFDITTVDISNCTITGVTNGETFTYNGTDVKPAITISYNGITLTENTDYKVTYTGTTNGVGSAAVYISTTGSNNFTGTKIISYNIISGKKDISGATVSSISAQTYTGSAIEPQLTITYSGTSLTKGTDYTVSYSNNTNVGTATVAITGAGSYEGNITKTFVINARSISDGTVSSIAEQTYTGSAIEPVVSLTVNNKTLTKGTDYTVSYSNNTKAGTAKVVLTGINNYTGTVETSFTIKEEATTTEAPTTTEEKTTAAPTTTEEKTTAAPTTTEEKTTAVPTTTEEKTTTAPTTTEEKTTAAPTTTEEKTTAAPATTEEKTTAVPTTTEEKTTAVPTTTEEKTTAAPASSEEGSTAAPASSEEGSTVAPARSEEGSTAAPASSEEGSTAAPAISEKNTATESTTQATTKKPTSQTSTTEKPTTEKATTEKATTEKATTEKATTQKTPTEKPTTQAPTTEKATTEKPATSKKATVKKPAKVKSVSVKSVTTSTAKLTWKKVSNADGYMVYTKDAKGKVKLVKTVSKKVTSYKIKKLSAGKKYTYYVCAYKKSGSKKIASAKKSCSFVTKPKTVTKVKVKTKTKKSVTVSWKKNSSATGYIVYMSTSKNGKYKKVAQTTKSSITIKKLKKNKKYYFKIKSYKKVKGKKIVYSNLTKAVKGKTKKK